MKVPRSLLYAGLLLVAISVRSVGLFRGLERGASFHPDVAKQIVATHNFLSDRYVWYVGSLAYDGYPYGLNHVDEWVLRATWPLMRAVARGIQPALQPPAQPTVALLYYLCTSLRVVYSLGAWALLGWILSRMGVSLGGRAVWLLLAALAPLSSTVTHAATGDVGTDLFVMLALALFAHARLGPPRIGLWAGVGIALGMAFACKYHGLLAGLAPGLYLVLAPLSWRARIRLASALAVGALAGFALLTPAVFLDLKPTLKNIWLNFGYIKYYGAPAGFKDLPLLERWRVSCIANLPVIHTALGSATLGLALVAAATALRRLIRERSGERAFDAALMAMPFGVLLLSMLGKPALQPFHFSFLALPMLLGPALVRLRAGRALRFAMGLLLVWMLGQSMLRQRSEWGFWRRVDTREVADALQEDLILPSADPAPAHSVALLAVEEDCLPVFRNKPQKVRLPRVSDWAANPNEWLPATPWGVDSDWVFADLPAFPRDSRLLAVEGGSTLRRWVIQRAEVPFLTLLLMAGSRESAVRLVANGREQRLELGPGETRVVQIAATNGVAFSRDGYRGRRQDIRLHARGGPLLVRFGPVPALASDPERTMRKLAVSKFLDGQGRFKAGLLMLGEAIPLLPGRYAIELDAPAEIRAPQLVVRDAVLHHPLAMREAPFVYTGNVWRAECPIDARFADVEIRGGPPSGRPIPWRIRPLAADPLRISSNAVAEAPAPRLTFHRGRWALDLAAFPTQLSTGATLRFQLSIHAREHSPREIGQYAAFLHFLDAEGRQVYARDIPLMAVPSCLDARGWDQDLGPLPLPSGNYEVRLGIYQPRTLTRLRPDQNATRDRTVPIGTLKLH